MKSLKRVLMGVLALGAFALTTPAFASAAVHSGGATYSAILQEPQPTS
ncbi:hypothetical protein [Alicyclobacillus vulcanalis]|nr:hypothetical protein [Alicyclobacillus vulcanalis]